jgi:hypothetical protein
LPIATCGIDWAQDHHDIALVNTDGQLLAKRRIPESIAGFTELTAMLAEAGDNPNDPIPVAIETVPPGRDRACELRSRLLYPLSYGGNVRSLSTPTHNRCWQ